MFSFFKVKGHSMEPYYKEGDFVAALPLFLSDVKLRDVVILKHPKNETVVLIKRVVQIQKDNGNTTYWVAGDTASDSIDSTAFGWVPKKHLVGKVHIIRKGILSR